MNSVISSTNVTFDFLKGSANFLSLVLDNVSSVVMLLNSKMELVAFNETIKRVFPSSKLRNLQYADCGEALGCVSNLDSKECCGQTSGCGSCELRVSAIKSYLEDKPTTRQKITKSIYVENGVKEDMTFLYSTRLFYFNGEKYLMLLIDPA